MQKNILVATDFSVTARNAFHYAEHLADAVGAVLTVAHITGFFSSVQELGVASDSKLDEAMTVFINDEDIAIGVANKKDIKTQVIKGDPTTILVDLSKGKEADWIVIGSTGLQDFISEITGSVSIIVSNNAQCPVFLIPNEVTWRPIRRILFASNVTSVQPKMIQQIIAFAEIFSAAIHFVHVDNGKHEDFEISNKIWDEFLSKKTPTVSFQAHSINHDDAVQGLHHYTQQHNIDLVTFISPHRSFWQHLLTSSVTERFSLVTDCPMLVMHIDDEVIG